MNMKADILRQRPVDDPTTTTDDGAWAEQQDPFSHEIIRVWVPAVDDVDTPDVDESTLDTFRCLARGIIDGGIRVAGTTERFSDVYEGVDYVRIWFPAGVQMSKRDQVTNIRDPKGNIIWREYDTAGHPPTVYNVNGVTPIIDPFGRHIENMALLERAERQ